jgi:uncharacterized protein (TIGR02271 family)
MALNREDVLTWRGQTLYDNDADKVGTIEEIYLDQQTEEPEWAVVTTGLFGTKQTFVPITDATTTDGGVRVPYTKSQVKDAPAIDPDGALSHEEERELYGHYGRDYTGNSGSGTTATDRTDRDRSSEEGGPGHDTSGPNTDAAMTRSEEELHVGTTERETGRVRLRKYVVEDEVTQTVPIRREEIRVEREPITDANAGDALEGPDISEEEHEVVLHKEEVVVGKQAVPKERIRLQKDVETSEETVAETVRSERIDVDDDRR